MHVHCVCKLCGVEAEIFDHLLNDGRPIGHRRNFKGNRNQHQLSVFKIVEVKFENTTR